VGIVAIVSVHRGKSTITESHISRERVCDEFLNIDTIILPELFMVRAYLYFSGVFSNGSIVIKYYLEFAQPPERSI
jgi:hypothetical protein